MDDVAATSSNAKTRAATGGWALWVGLILAPLLALAAYAPAIAGATWFADDAFGLATHAHHGDILGEWTHPTFVWASDNAGHVWRPMMASTQHAVAIFFGREAEPQRWLNLLIHMLNAALLLLTARRLGSSALVAMSAAVAWVLHPALTEAVAWASALGDVLSATFMLLLLWHAAGPRPRGGVAALLMALACLTKESAVAFIPVAPALLFFRGQRRAAFFVSVGVVGAAGGFLGAHRHITDYALSGTAASSPFAEQLLAWMGYLGWLLRVPHQAGTAHLFNPAETGLATLGMLTIMGLGALALYAWKREPAALPLALTALLAWVVMLSPAGMATPMAGPQPFRYAYAPSLVSFALLFSAAGLCLRGRAAALAPIVAGLMALTGGPRVAQRAADWQGPAALWAAELQVEPTNGYAMANLGRTLYLEGQIVEGLKLWRQGIGLAPPGRRFLLFDPPRERYDLAQAAFIAGDPGLALEQIRLVLRGVEARGERAPANAYCLLADSLDAMGDHEAARAAAQRCEGG